MGVVLDRRCRVGSWAFRCIWLTVVTLHLVFAVFPLVVAMLYIHLPTLAPRIVKNAEMFSASVPRRFYNGIAAVYLALATAHLYTLAQILYSSLSQRRMLLLNVPQRPRADVICTTAVLPKPKPAGGLRSQSYRNGGVQRTHHNSVSAQLRRGFRVAWQSLDVTDRNYDAYHIVREITETALLSYQTYRSSYLVARPWINDCFMILLVLNCWATPLIRRTLRSRIFLARLLGLTANIALDTMSYVVVPTVLFLPYFKQLDDIGNYVVHDFWYTDRWLLRVVTEWRMLFVTSFWDGMSKLFIAVSIIRALREIPKLIIPPVQGATGPARTHLDAPAGKLRREGASRSVVEPQHRRWTVLADRLERLGLLTLAVWGAVITGVHIHAASHPTNHQCAEQVRPWLARRTACSLMEINCQRNARSGSALEFQRAVDVIDNQWLSYLVIRHCPRVEVTTSINLLHNPIGLKIFNSTIVRWEEDAALTQRHHPLVMFVFLAQVNVSELPRGLYHADFPQRLLDIEFCRVNITVLPDTLARVWPKGLFLLLEELRFSQFPDVVAKLQVKTLSLAMNSFDSVSAAIFENPVTEWVKLNGNPVHDLPSTLTSIPPLQFLFLEHTGIVDLPAWIPLKDMRDVRAGDSPLCRTLISPSPSDDEGSSRLHTLENVVSCTPPASTDELYHYPISKELVLNP
ncbi:hypothetical protein P43SY_005996 [Pythium insidiosum]|uniref:Uncharacterized protein n=1 Tax=Pythium insidiosum TaxID=114742 RepID=A0AAD5LKF9_PYTIN|nr:hypothetical protein P43SY_005996 [Pythium insidiosum]